MSTLRALTCLTIAAAALLGCKPEDQPEDQPPAPIESTDAAQLFAEQICAAVYDCECSTATNFPSEDDCVAEQRVRYQSTINDFLVNGGTWNADCAGQMAAAWAKWQCLGPSAASREFNFDPRQCPVYKGTSPAGADCNNYSIGDDCNVGLACISGICMDGVELPVPIGQACEVEWETLPCVAGSYCTYSGQGDTAICVALPSAGDSCDPGLEFLCGPSSRDLVCDMDSATCQPAPGTGESCEQQQVCAPGNYCDGGKDFTCQPRVELGDSCGANAICPTDASCVGNICEADQAAACGLIYFW